MLPLSVFSHPVTFKGGVAVVNTFRPTMANIHVNYTFVNNLAGGLTYNKMTLLDRDVEMSFAQVNYLVKRWNKEGSQANVYVLGGAGYGVDSLKENGLAFKGTIQGDFETREFYTALSGGGWAMPSTSPYFVRYRIGAAPYKADYKELQVWMIAQLDYQPSMQSGVMVSPLLRFFYRNALWEIGASTTGQWWLQLMAHY